MRPGVMERLGLGPEVVHELNSKLIYGRMTGWGEGPLAKDTGHDLNYIGRAYGMLNPSEPPATRQLGGRYWGGAMYLAVGMLSGFLSVKNGLRDVVDAIVDGAAHMMSLLMSCAALGAL